MKISQILNNNVAMVKRGSNEIIVYSKGIAFRRKAGQQITEDEIQKIYVLDSQDKLEHFSYLLSNTKDIYLQIVNEIIEYGKNSLNEKIPDYLYMALLDHIDYVIKRIKKGQIIKSPLTLEVKKFYPNYYKVGLYSINLISEKLDMEIPEDEAISIALHFINLQNSSTGSSDIVKVMETVKDMLAIIKYHFKINLEDDSISYMRLVTHLQYFATRLLKKNVYSSKEDELNKQIQSLYPQAYLCVNKIKVYVRNSFQTELTNDEETYLMLHIQRVTQR